MLAVVVLVGWLAPGNAGNGSAIGTNAAVKVIVDMDAQSPGIQSNVSVPAGTTVVDDIAVYIFDPAQRPLWGIGYVGGIDRGIAFGHMPNAGNQGEVADISANLESSINPDNFATISSPPGLDPGFVGPELQYIEGGAAHAVAIPAAP
ncbi:MAG: hypothetical protein ACYSXF_09490, partial [Planctomycetota bacterium]